MLRLTDWISGHPGAGAVGLGTTGPLYFAPTTADGTRVRLFSIGLDGILLILFNELSQHPPFDRVSSRIGIQERLNRIIGVGVRDDVVEVGTWQSVDGGFLLSPGAFDQFTSTYEWVARQLAQQSPRPMDSQQGEDRTKGGGTAR